MCDTFYNLFLFETTCAISAHHHWSCVFQSRFWYLIQHYVITFVSDLRKVGCILWVLRYPQANQTNRHDIAEILFESGVKHHNHRNKISEYFPWNIIIPLCHLFICGNKISDNPAAAPLPPFTYMPLRRGVLATTYVIKFVGDLPKVHGFFRVLRFPPVIIFQLEKSDPMVSIIVL